MWQTDKENCLYKDSTFSSLTLQKWGKRGQISSQTAQLQWKGFTLKAAWLDPDCVNILWKWSTDKMQQLMGDDCSGPESGLIGSKRYSGNFRTHGKYANMMLGESLLKPCSFIKANEWIIGLTIKSGAKMRIVISHVHCLKFLWWWCYQS